MSSGTDSNIHSELAAAAREMHAHVPRGHDDVLARVCASAVEVVPGVFAAGVTLVQKKHEVSTLGGTNEDAALFDRLQERHGGGPCLQAAWTDEMVLVDDFASEIRWPALGADVVSSTAIRASVSYRLFTTEHGIGALNLYFDRPHSITGTGIEAGYALATYASLVVDAAQRQEQFDSALASRDIIGQAKGMVMERFDVDAGRAFELLKTLSQNSNIPVAEVARRLVTADHPEN